MTVRQAFNPPSIENDIDRDLYEPLNLNSNGERSCTIANGFSGTFVLLAACGREQKAYEDANRGVFTSCLIEILTNEDIHTLTYTSLVHKMNLKMSKQYVSAILLCPLKKNLRLLSGKLPIVRDKKLIGGYLTSMSLTPIVLLSLQSASSRRSSWKPALRRASQLVLE